MEHMLLNDSRENNDLGVMNSEKVSATNIIKFIEYDSNIELREKNSYKHNLMTEIMKFSSNSTFTSDSFEDAILKAKPPIRSPELIRINNINYFQVNDAVFERVSKFNTIAIKYPEEKIFEDEDPARNEGKSLKKNEKKRNIYKFSQYLSKKDYLNFVFLTLYFKYANESNFSSTDSIRDKDFDDFQKKIEKINEPIVKEMKSAEKACLDLQKPTESMIAESFMKNIVQTIGQKHNINNNYLMKFIKTLHHNPHQEERLYYYWKVNFGKLVALWDFKKTVCLKNKINIKYLKIKFLLIKLFRIKEKELLFAYLPKEEEEKSFLSISNISSLVNNNQGDNYPRFSFILDSYTTVLFDFAVDATILYRLFILPMDYVLKFSSVGLSYIEQICNILYFVDIIRRFRTLSQDEMKNQDNNLSKPFQQNITSFSFILDLISLSPFDVMYAVGNPDIRNDGIVLSKFYVMLRIFRFGRSFKFLDSTKYAVVFRLLKLMGQFVFLIHWLGLFLLIYFEKEMYERNFDESCNTYDPITKYTKYCLYVETLYSGAFIVPGRTLNGWDLLAFFRITSQYVFLFAVFLTGQIITASVFGSVSALISSLNQAENKFQEINDNHRITGSYYKFDKEMFDEVQIYYEYIWLKHREKIFGMEIFENLSPILMRRYLKELLSDSYLYLLKDFILLKKKKNKFMTFIINNITKQITSPYERIVTQGEVIRGLFILSNGTVFFEDEKTKRKDLGGEMRIYPKLIGEKLTYVADKLYDKYINDKICFPLDSLFLKTGRAIQTYYSKYFADFYFLPIEIFDEHMIDKYPYEMNELSMKAKKEGLPKIGKDFILFNLIDRHSYRSTGKYYEAVFNDVNIWIEIKQTLPKFKLKYSTLANKLDVIESLNYSNGLFEMSYTTSRYLIAQLKL